MKTEQSERTKQATPSYDLTGKRVVVVGGKAGIGLGIAHAAHAAGASVTVASRRSASVTEHPELAPRKQIRLDISDDAAVRAAFDAIGQLDHLVVAAGPTDGSWGAFMDDDMRGVLSFPEAVAAEVREKVRTEFPAGRLGQPADIGHAAVFLMTDPYVTGIVLDVTGGEQLVDWLF